MTADRVIAFRDPAGLRPLVLGQVGDRYCVASESCAFDIIGAKLLREVEPGEVVRLGEGEPHSRMVAPGGRRAFCVFEHIYFARPDSQMNGRALQVTRARMGEILWREAPVEADVVIAVPDSGNAAARGLARATPRAAALPESGTAITRSASTGASRHRISPMRPRETCVRLPSSLVSGRAK